MQHQHQHHHHPFFDFDATSTYAPLQSSDQSSSVTIPRSHARASPALFTTKARNIDLSVLDHQYSSPVPVREETRGKTYPVPVGGGRFAFVGGNGGGERAHPAYTYRPPSSPLPNYFFNHHQPQTHYPTHSRHGHSHSQSHPRPDPLANPMNTSNVYINNIPPSFTPSDLYNLTKPFGAVKIVRTFVREHGTCYGFVLFESIESARTCIIFLREHSHFHPAFARTQKIPSITSSTGEYQPPPSAPTFSLPAHLQAQAQGGVDEGVDLIISGLPNGVDLVMLQSLVAPHSLTSATFASPSTASIRVSNPLAAREVIDRLHGRRIRGWSSDEVLGVVIDAEKERERQKEREKAKANEHDDFDLDFDFDFGRLSLGGAGEKEPESITARKLSPPVTTTSRYNPLSTSTSRFERERPAHMHAHTYEHVTSTNNNNYELALVDSYSAVEPTSNFFLFDDEETITQSHPRLHSAASTITSYSPPLQSFHSHSTSSSPTRSSAGRRGSDLTIHVPQELISPSSSHGSNFESPMSMSRTPTTAGGPITPFMSGGALEPEIEGEEDTLGWEEERERERKKDSETFGEC